MRIRLTLLLAAALLIAGCAGLLRSGIGRPTVSVEDARLASLSFQGASLQFDFGIDNPNPVGLHLDGFDYALSVEGTPLLSGRQDSKLELAANGKRTVGLPVTVRYQDLWAGLRQVVQKRDAAYLLEAGFSFDLPVLGRVRIPVRREGSLPLLRLPKIRLDRVSVRGLTARGADLALTLAVENPNDLAADLQGIDTTLTLAGRALGRVTSDRAVHLPAGGTQTVEVPLHLDLVQVGTAVTRLLSDGGVVDYALKGDLSLTSTARPDFIAAEIPFAGDGRTELQTRP